MNRGFTLIELLVTVVIISILSAVALPQYQRAINRTRITEAVTNLGTLQRGIDAYCAQFGNSSTNEVNFLGSGATRLDADIRGGLNCAGEDFCTSRTYNYSAECNAHCGQCVIALSALPGSSAVLPDLSATRTKSGLSATWVKECSNAGDFDYCANLIESGGFVRHN